MEHFIELVPLKKADANTIYETLIDCLKKKGLMISNMIGMGSHFFWQTQCTKISSMGNVLMSKEVCTTK